ncbi:MAG: hypothetical protein ACR2NZ_21425 [Rubripirellula sp.]
MSRSPFQSGDPDTFFSGESHREAMAGLAYFASSNWKLALLTGPRRCGTTELLKHVVQMQGLGGAAIDAILTSGGPSGPESLFATLRRAMGFRNESGEPKRDVETAIRESDRHGLRTVWMIDPCDINLVAIASDMAQRHRNLSVVMTGHSNERTTLSLAAGMCCMRIDMQPLSLSEVNDFLRHGMKGSGGTSLEFSENATVRLHELTDGIVGDLALAAESSLMLAANHSLQQVTPDVVEATMEIAHLWRGDDSSRSNSGEEVPRRRRSA